MTEGPGPIEGKVVAVTGASSGIGKATAALFAAHGARVVLLARDPSRLEEAAAEVGHGARAIPVDLQDAASVGAAFGAVADAHGRLDVLLNVAGVARARTIEETTDEDIATVVGTNLLGPIHTTRAAVPLLRAAGGGDIVNVSSESTMDPMPFLSLYAASKAGLETFTHAMNRELKQHDIRVSLLVAGLTSTGFAVNFTDEDRAKAYPAWKEGGYTARLAGTEPQDPAWVAEALLFAVTRPRGQMIDLIHARAFR